MSFFTIQHHGAVNGVTGSCHELRFSEGHGSAGILIDCGLFQGDEKSSTGESHHQQLSIDFPIEHIKALVVTHVHIDHVGRIPYLLAAGFDGPILCSEPSALLLPLVLEDAFKIGVTRDKRMIDKFLRLIKQRIQPIAYKQWHTVWQQGEQRLRIKLQRAGHILGSAYVECDIQYRGKQKNAHRVVFSGDLGAPYAPLLSAPRSPYRADTLVIESTYGDRLHEDRRHRRQRLKRVIEKALQDKGTVLIPAFSIGRTQEILYELETLIHELGHRKAGTTHWDELDVIVDSPLANDFTAAYKKLKPFWDNEAQKRLQRGRHPLSFDQLITVNEHSQHQYLVNHLRSSGRPCIVIAASGMCAGGRIMNYLKALIDDNRTDIVFIGYQAKGTPGRDIQTYGPRGGYVFLDGERYDIKAGVHTLSGYSAHADQANLVNFVSRMRVKPKYVRIVHGDDEAKETLQTLMTKKFRDVAVVVPTR